MELRLNALWEYKGLYPVVELAADIAEMEIDEGALKKKVEEEKVDESDELIAKWKKEFDQELTTNFANAKFTKFEEFLAEKLR